MKAPAISRRITIASLRCLLVLLPFLSAATLGAAGQTNQWSLSSPDNQCGISVSLNSGVLTYQTFRNDRVVIDKSPLGLRLDDQNFTNTLTLDSAGNIEARTETYILFADPQPSVKHVVNHRSLSFHNSDNSPLEIDLAATDEGVAFRYRLSSSSTNLHTLAEESTGFNINPNSCGWLQPYHAAGPYTPAYEDFYFHVSPGDRPPDSRAKGVGWAFPALFQIPDADTWILITESGTDEAFCACHLKPDSTGGAYHIAFPLADETTQGYTNSFGPEPRHSLPWTMPWRVIVMAKSPAEISTERLVTDLAPPSQIENTDWIHPGRASWAWWSYPDKPASKKHFDEFTDFAARMGWEYTLFDAGWWGPGLSPIAKHAIAEKVAPLAWLHAVDFYDAKKRAAKLDQMQVAGIRGVKVDFWCSDRQEAIQAQQALMRDAAERKMLVNLHGCTIPRGWERTWPNFITCEAVLGSESYFYEPHYTEKAAELDTVLPFTRNAIGPMDLTPIACSPKKYERTTTAAHQLATAIIFTSGIIHYADNPEFFDSLPPAALQIFRDAPARWDETRCLIGEPGRLAVFARRAGDFWLIAGINGTGDSLPISVDLSAFKDFTQRSLVSEAADAAIKVTITPQTNGGKWQHEIPARGGFILRLTK